MDKDVSGRQDQSDCFGPGGDVEALAANTSARAQIDKKQEYINKVIRGLNVAVKAKVGPDEQIFQAVITRCDDVRRSVWNDLLPTVTVEGGALTR